MRVSVGWGLGGHWRILHTYDLVQTCVMCICIDVCVCVGVCICLPLYICVYICTFIWVYVVCPSLSSILACFMRVMEESAALHGAEGGA